MEVTWPAWRLVVEKIATLRELEDGTYSIDDVADAHEALDVFYEAQGKAQEPR